MTKPEKLCVQWTDGEQDVVLTIHCATAHKAKKLAESINDELSERSKVTITVLRNGEPD